VEADLKATSLLRRVPTLADVGNAAAFMASDRARAVTAPAANLACGTVVD
jgi:3-oxoacyl-[acyl-carrier protein] reductase